MNRDHVINRFAAELTKAAGASIQAHASSRPGAELKSAGVLVNITSREADYGTLLVFFSDATADALTRLSTSAQDGDEIGATESVRRLCALYGWNVRVVPGNRQGVVATLSFSPDTADAAETATGPAV